MKKYFCLFILFLFASFASAQTQQGYVKTRGKVSAKGASIPGTRIPGATISIQSGASMVSAKNGTFSFGVPTKMFALSNVRKNGYELCDRDLLGKYYNYSENPFIIVMDTRESQLAENSKLKKGLQPRLKNNTRRRCQNSSDLRGNRR